MKRAQTATEYLILLAVVIVIALIVISVPSGVHNFTVYADFDDISLNQTGQRVVTVS